MGQQRSHASRRRFLQGGAVGVIGGLLSGCLGDELEADGFEGGVEWQATFGGERGDRAESIIETSDGGYLFAGETRSFAEEDGNAWVVKIDSHGHEEWSYSIGGERRDMASSVIESGCRFIQFRQYISAYQKNLYVYLWYMLTSNVIGYESP